MATKKLLVADDSLTIQKVIRLALSGAAAGSSDGYEIQAVSDGNDAVQQISLFRPDIVLIDVSLPGKSAFEVKRAVNQHRDLDNVRFVLMSSAFEKVDEPQVAEVEFHGRLTKPFDPAHLRDVLSQVLAMVPEKASSKPGHAHRNETTRVFENPLETPPPLPPSEFSESFSPPPPIPPMNELPHELKDVPVITGMPELPETTEPEGDIRNLTESTIRMSGLADLGNEPAERADRRFDAPPAPPSFASEMPPEPPSDFGDDFQWSVQEHSIKPPSPLMDAGNSTFPMAPPPEYPNEHSRFITRPTREELEFTPPPPPSEPFEEFAPPPPAGPSSQPQGQPPSLAQAQQQAQSWASRTAASVSSASETHQPRAASPAVDVSEIEAKMKKEMEGMVRQEVEKALRRFAHEVLPDVAERVIKEEIHKLLSESS